MAMMRTVRAVALVALAGLIVACSAESGTDPDPLITIATSGPQGSTDGTASTPITSHESVDQPVITGAPSDSMPTALVAGRVRLDGACIRLDIDDVGAVIPVWPHGTRWDDQKAAIVLVDGRTIRNGDYIEGGGGYFSASTIGEILPTVLDRVTACLPDSASVATNDQVVLAFPDIVTAGQSATDTSEATAAPPTTAGTSETPFATGREAFSDVLADLGVDVADAPANVFGTDEQVVCGAEILTHTDYANGHFNEIVRRCFIDSHLAGVPAAFASSQPTIEGDPIVTVWTSSIDDGVRGWLDSTRDAYGSGGWQQIGACGRLTTNTPATVQRPPFEFACENSLITSQPPQRPASVPADFRDRAVLPLCGYSIRIADVDESERQCFQTAVSSGQPAEFAYLSTGDEGEVLVRWFRSLGAGELEVFSTLEDLNGKSVTWTRSACKTITFIDEPGFEIDGLPSDCNPP
jgi:hypothetical protein